MFQISDEDHVMLFYKRGSEEIAIKYDVNSSMCNDLDIFIRFQKAIGYTDDTIKDGILELAREFKEEQQEEEGELQEDE